MNEEKRNEIQRVVALWPQFDQKMNVETLKRLVFGLVRIDKDNLDRIIGIDEDDIDNDHLLSLIYMLLDSQSFSKSFNPIFALRAFVRGVKHNYVPPYEVLHFLSEGIEKYLNSQAPGNTLEACLGIKVGKGQKPKKQKARQFKKYKSYCFLVEVYRIALGVSVSDAAGIVEGVFRNEEKPPTKDWIEEVYYKQKNDVLDLDLNEALRILPEILDRLGEYETDSLLEGIPDHYLPPGLK